MGEIVEHAKLTGQDMIWLNVKRSNVSDQGEMRYPNYFYQSDNKNITWDDLPPGKPFGEGEDCIQITFVQWNGVDWLRGGTFYNSPWRAIWNQVKCGINGQIVCQTNPEN